MDKINSKTAFNNENGFTLIEVVLSVAILSIFILVITQFMGISVTNIFLKGEQSKALAAAEDKMEKIYAAAEDAGASTDLTDYNDLKKSEDGWIDCSDDDDVDAVLVNGADYSPIYCLQNVTNLNEDGGEATGTQVTVVAFYHNGQHKVKLTNFIAQIE